ncbi:MAG: bifunctional homocysteine S-methyltransferase/methylenetetrahydrofolate reductase [Oscillospiraceae bacterium]|nr:bifunctional homocysteine S-methyltransferase/methylenetetrahydrofolate reductase [Oscillospiraceae bacterium]
MINKYPLIFDGGFGTLYYELTSDESICEKANLITPEIVEKIHREYIKAGADCITTNTFGINSETFPDIHERIHTINEGFSIANKAAAESGRDIKVFADFGTMSSCEKPSEEYLINAKEFINLKANYFIFETQTEFTPLIPALKYIKEKNPDAFIIVSFAVSADGFTSSGLYYKTLISDAEYSPYTSAVGINCVCGPAHMARLVSDLPKTVKPLSVMPNAGYPSSINGRIYFRSNYKYFADKIAEMRAYGAMILGGCCGTTPEHISEISNIIKGSADGASTVYVTSREEKKHEQTEKVTNPQSALFSSGRSLIHGKKFIAAEIAPPPDTDISYTDKTASDLYERGADVITVSDSPLARVRADSLITAAHIKHKTGLDVMPHLTCRDRNFIAIKGGLIALASEGINKIFIITGDPPAKSTGMRVPSVYGFNSYELLKYISELNREIFESNPFCLGAAMNVNATNFSGELVRIGKKLEAGAKFFMTQPIFTETAIKNIRQAKREYPDTVMLAGIMPVAGYKNAVFLNNEVSGMTVPNELIDNLKDASTEEARKVSVAFSINTIDALYNYCEGFYFMIPLRKTCLVTDLIDYIKRKETKE